MYHVTATNDDRNDRIVFSTPDLHEARRVERDGWHLLELGEDAEIRDDNGHRIIVRGIDAHRAA